MHPLLLSCTLKFVERAISQNQNITSTLSEGICCDRLHYNSVIVPLFASVVIAIFAPAFSGVNSSEHVSSAISHGIRDAIDRTMLVLELTKCEAFLKLVPAIEMTSVVMLKSHLTPALFDGLRKEVSSYIELLFSQDFEEKTPFPPYAEVLFISLSSNFDVAHQSISSVSKSSFAWEAAQMSLLSQATTSTSSVGNTAIFSPVSGLLQHISSLPAYIFSALPLNVFTRSSDNRFEITVVSGIECIGLSSLSRRDMHLHPHLLDDATRCCVLHLSNSSRSCVFRDGRLLSVLPPSSSDVAPAINVLYSPSQQSATFSISQMNWSHTFEGLPSTELYLFAKLRSADGLRAVTWTLADDVLQNEPIQHKYLILHFFRSS
jgi:hypothetical protein